MHPSFGQLFGAPISAYFSMLLLGYALAVALVALWAKRRGLDVQAVIDCGLAAVIGGIVGGRILHVLADGYFMDYVHLCTDPAQVSFRITSEQCAALPGRWDGGCHPLTRDCWAWARFYNGGLAFYGGLLLGTAAVLWLARRDGLPRRQLADVSAIAVAAALACGRVGCFLAGCCYGEVTALPLGVRFPAWSPASEGQFRAGLLAHPGELSLPVHPTQLYEALGCLLLAGLLAWRWSHKHFAGEIALLGLLGYALLRFGVELVRADDRGHWLALSTSQWLGLAIMLACAASWQRCKRALDAADARGSQDVRPGSS
jgi:phosphatidylglycerol---prolipoprotein diacylglyceryl transferase